MSGQGKQAEHLRGIGGRGAEDADQGAPRPDEVEGGRPPAAQATHAGMPVAGPLAEPRDDSGVGRDSRIAGDRPAEGHSRYRRPGAEAEGAFGEEEPE